MQTIKSFNTEFQKLTGKTIPENELKQAWSRIQFTYDPLKLSLFQGANNAYDIGFLAKGKPRPDLSGIYDLTILNQVLKEKGLQPIRNSRRGRRTSGSNSVTSRLFSSLSFQFFYVYTINPSPSLPIILIIEKWRLSGSC